jgi:pyruvate ferredoxin oxidoreductase alpha subunit
MKLALEAIPEIDDGYAKISGRHYKTVHPYRMEDAEFAIIGLGSTMGTVRNTVDALREEGVKAGHVKIRVFRPFPMEDLFKAVGNVPVVGVLDRSVSFGAPGGPLYEEVKTSFYEKDDRPLIANFIYGLGGRDMSPTLIKSIIKKLELIGSKGEVDERVSYIGVRE